MKRWLILTVLGVVACGPSETPSTGDMMEMNNTTTPTGKDRPAWLISHAPTCAEIDMCPERLVHDGSWPIFARHTDEASCLQDPYVKASGEGHKALVDRGIKEGRLERDATAWRACLDALQAAGEASTCSDTSFGVPAECDERLLYVGKAKQGEVCLHPRECETGLSCYVENRGDCYATCQDLSPCGGTSCGDGQYCQKIGDTQECRPYKQLMQTCVASSECGVPGEGVCDFYATPEPDTGRCVSVSGTAPTKPEPRGEGNACSASSQCAWPLMCVQGACTNAMPEFGAAGEACDPQLKDLKLCQRGLVCGVELSVDQEAMSLIVEGSCREPSATGGPCYVLAECQPGHVCVGANPQMLQPGMCAQALGLGESCELDIACASGYCKSLGSQGQCASRSACVLP